MKHLHRRALLALGLPLSLAHAEDPTCDVDQVVDVVCGVSTTPTCSSDLTTMSSLEWQNPLVRAAAETLPATGAPDEQATTVARIDHPNHCCVRACATLVVGPRETAVGFGEKLSLCVPPFATSAPTADVPACAGSVAAADRVLPFQGMSMNGMCCYEAPPRPPPPVLEPRPRKRMRGRPVRVGDRACTADVAEGGGWGATASGAPDAAQHGRWASEATMEHASVAAFARLSLQLMALGAPWELIDRCHEAARDEVRHAVDAYRLASRHGPAVRPTPFPQAAAPIDLNMEALVRHTLEDGCWGEGVAAEEARLGAGECLDPEIREVLQTVARDEAEHMALAWEVVRWAKSAHPAESTRAIEAFLANHPMDSTPQPAVSTAVTGHLEPGRVARLRQRVLGEVVRPCLHALLAA